MKTSKQKIATQREIVDKKLKPWVPLRNEKRPASGWLKAIRGALGINTRQLAALLGLEHSSIQRLEKREVKGSASFEVMDRVAEAMGCKLVYAIVPKTPYKNLESIIDERARKVATEISQRVAHSMALESQGSDMSEVSGQVQRLAFDLKSKMDARLWKAQGGVKKKSRK